MARLKSPAVPPESLTSTCCVTISPSVPVACVLHTAAGTSCQSAGVALGSQPICELFACRQVYVCPLNVTTLPAAYAVCGSHAVTPQAVGPTHRAGTFGRSH